MKKQQKGKPFLFITAGDPLGIGPEVTVKALQNPRIREVCTPVLIGERDTLLKAGFTPALAQLIDIQSQFKRPSSYQPVPCAWAGDISFRALELAARLTAEDEGSALVTAPINKQSWAKSGVPFTGHTEFLRKYYGKTALMMFVGGAVRCALVSEHFAIKDLHKVITRARIERAGRDLHSALQRLGIKRPHIGVCSLNPHGGDNGRFGQEEGSVILPALKTLQAEKINAEGPYPVDSLWLAHKRGNFDAILCMYHDQALLGLKLATQEPVVHITAGLDFLRVSPTHGTAYDIAGKNKADPSSMQAAILFAVSQVK